jgi:hypothetical protein
MLTEKELEESLMTSLVLKNKVQKMFEMQHELNLLIAPDWYTPEKKESGWDFQRAVMIEAAELMDHYGYKWWKHQTPDIEQCKLEVIDITHFYISYLIQKSMIESQDPYYYVQGFADELKVLEDLDDSALEVRAFIDYLIEASAQKAFDIEDLNILLNLFQITPDELCDTYIIKNTLNIFRARNGYKQGTYVKTWGGREDNEVLMDVSHTLNHSLVSFADDLYIKLAEEYSKYN